MPTLTIRNLPADLVDRIKARAEARGNSMESEVRELLRREYTERTEMLRRLRERTGTARGVSTEEIDAWIREMWERHELGD